MEDTTVSRRTKYYTASIGRIFDRNTQESRGLYQKAQDEQSRKDERPVAKHSRDIGPILATCISVSLLEITTSNLKAEKHRSVDEYHTV